MNQIIIIMLLAVIISYLIYSLIKRVIKTIVFLIILFFILILLSNLFDVSFLHVNKTKNVIGMAGDLASGLGSLFPNKIEKVNELKEKVSYKIIGMKERTARENFAKIKIVFCPKDNCTKTLLDSIKQTKEFMYCAFYNLDSEEIISAINELIKKGVDVRIIIDNNYEDNIIGKIKCKDCYISDRSDDKPEAYMHNKFCIIDNSTIITGSANPTYNGLNRNDNNIIIIKGVKQLVKNYYEEFKEMWEGSYHGGKATLYTTIFINTTYFNGKVEKGVVIKNYFCPEDHCRDKVLRELNNANSSIYFLLFSFTDDSIGNMIIDKHEQGVEIKGVVEKRQNKNNKYSEYKKLVYHNISVLYDYNKYNMHNKMFIIDNLTIITGSYNPTNNANYNNDENIIIIKSKKLAQLCTDYFKWILDKSQSSG